MQFLLLITLLIQSYWDLRYKAIPLLVTASAGGMGLLLSLLSQREGADLLWALVPGVVCLGVGRLTRQAIGYGDGFLLCAMGMYVSCESLLSICMTACMVAGVVALGLLAFRRKRGKDQIPFVPFLLVAAIMQCLLEKGSIL